MSVYCDSGGYRRELGEMESLGQLKVYQYRYDANGNRKIKSRPPSSNPTWSEGDSTWDQVGGTWEDFEKQSEKWPKILRLLGASNVKDAKHLDSAYMAGCAALITSDKDDLCRNAVAIKELLNVSVFHCMHDWDAFVAFVQCGC